MSVLKHILIYAGLVVDRRLTIGYCIFLGGNLVTSKTKRQSVVVRSYATVEFWAMPQEICELLWLKIRPEDLKIKWDGPIKLYCDNKSIISIVHIPVQHNRTKYIEVEKYFIKEKLNTNMIWTLYVSSQWQLIDILTKGLNNNSFERVISKLGMKNIYSLSWGGMLKYLKKLFDVILICYIMYLLCFNSVYFIFFLKLFGKIIVYIFNVYNEKKSKWESFYSLLFLRMFISN